MGDNSSEPDKLAERVQQEVGQSAELSLPPVDKWNPDFSGDLELCITRQGKWLYKGNPMERQALVKLFSNILRKDPDGCYYLVTPVEKFRIEVEDAPFVAHSLKREGEGGDQRLWLTTNVGERVLVDEAHPLRVELADESAEPAPYVRVRRNLDALLERQAFYDLAALADRGEGRFSDTLGVYSSGAFFPIGSADLS